MTTRPAIAALALAVIIQLTACGGGGGSGAAAPPPGSARTTFTGNLAEPLASNAASTFWAKLGLVAEAQAQSGNVEVCVEGTSFCTQVGLDGFFTLSADVGGDLVLVFDGPDFTARLPVRNVPFGATVRIEDIHCSTRTGVCTPENIEFLGNEPPICDDAFAIPAVLWPPNHDLTRLSIGGVRDPDGDDIAIFATSVVQDEPVLGNGSGNTTPDATLAPLAVRAEREGGGNGRVYVIDFVAQDGNGGACSGSVLVCVPHDQGNGASCGDDGARFDSLSD